MEVEEVGRSETPAWRKMKEESTGTIPTVWVPWIQNSKEIFTPAQLAVKIGSVVTPAEGVKSLLQVRPWYQIYLEAAPTGQTCESVLATATIEGFVHCPAPIASEFPVPCY